METCSSPLQLKLSMIVWEESNSDLRSLVESIYLLVTSDGEVSQRVLVSLSEPKEVTDCIETLQHFDLHA